MIRFSNKAQESVTFTTFSLKQYKTFNSIIGLGKGMKSKFVLLLIIGTLLVAGIYSASVFPVYGVKACWISNDGKLKFCTNSETKTWIECHKNSQGTFDCVKFSAYAVPPTDLPPNLQNALDVGIGESQNTTKVPKGSFLDDGGLLKGQGDNQTTSKTIVPTQDRFCLEGTGGSTGKACIHCDPGLTFEVGCVDVTTGGPLDMPDRATSETEEGDDTNPKDLDGSNNGDENGPNVKPGAN